MNQSSRAPKRPRVPELSGMILQGYDLTTAKYKASLYQKRMMLAVVNAAQARLAGEKHVAGRQFKVEDGEFPTVVVPIELILQNDESSNIYAVRKAAKDFIRRVIEYKTAEGDWVVFSPFITARIPRYGSEIHLQVHKIFWEAILDYRSGYRKLDVKRAIALKSVYAMRFYELLSGKTEPIVYPVDSLKEMFAIGDKYKQINDFIRKVLSPAKKELDAAAPYSFDFEPVKEGRKIIAFKFIPIHFPQRDDREAEQRDLQRKSSLSWDIRDRHVRDFIRREIGFTDVEIKNNIEVFRRAAELLPDLLGTLTILNGKSRDKKNPKGWIVRALQGKVQDRLDELGIDPTATPGAVSEPASDDLSPEDAGRLIDELATRLGVTR